ncbi:MAG: hypothetical protein JWO25_1139, partial [Alphaproteobacteria bacterium]|nr:hypothetical protein [Alphaproteobacteria bacterium]
MSMRAIRTRDTTPLLVWSVGLGATLLV